MHLPWSAALGKGSWSGFEMQVEQGHFLNSLACFPLFDCLLDAPT